MKTQFKNLLLAAIAVCLSSSVFFAEALASLSEKMLVQGIIHIVDENEVKLRIPGGLLVVPRNLIPAKIKLSSGEVLSIQVKLADAKGLKFTEM